jgi:ketopantoate hydroxymethyltransferase
MSTQTSNSGETTPGHSIPNPVKVTTQTVVEMKQKGEKISMLTAYDFTMARIIDAAGIDVLLVGDSASNVMAGNETTVPITLDHMIYHTQCVVRGVDRALVIADMPFMSYQVTPKRGSHKCWPSHERGRCACGKTRRGPKYHRHR